jgi:hypothetical protein
VIQKVKDSANKGAADDAKNIDKGIDAAMKSKDGVGLVNWATTTSHWASSTKVST